VSPSPDAATYVFCLVRAVRPPSLRGVPDSVPGAGPPRLVSIDPDMWAVVADAPLERFSGNRLETDLQDIEGISRHAVAHAAVIEFFFRGAPVIPLKMFTLFSTDEKLREHLHTQRNRLRKLFSDLGGLEEWGVRIVAGEVAAKQARSLTSGRDYLQVKKSLKDQAASPPRAVVRETRDALKTLGAIASRVKPQAYPSPGRGGPFVTGASMLVRTTRRDRWRKTVTRLTKALGEHGHLLEVSGPWPPYHFVSK
jgi:hypothetical protein